MQALQIGTLVCALISQLLLLIVLCSNYWLSNLLSNSGLWKSCAQIGSVTSCISHGMDVNDSTHATRAFLVFGMFAGAVACVGLCGIFFGWEFGSIPKAKGSAIASIVAALCILTAMSIYAKWAGPKASYGWSFSLGWATFPLFLITGGLAFLL